MRQALAFDMDGTVSDSMTKLAELAAQLIQAAFPDVSRDDFIDKYYETSGQQFGVQAKQIFPDRPVYPVVDEFEKRKREVMDRSWPFADAENAMMLLSREYDLWLVSSTRTQVCSDWLTRFGLMPFFMGVEGAGQNPYVESKAAKLLRIKPVAFVGDTANDAKAAEEAGVRFIGIQRDPRMLPDELASVTTLSEVHGIVSDGERITT